jgi:membrane protein implicated in regulation of membrane protease activity
MIDAVMVFLVGVGALLVSMASILQFAWLAVLVPLLIAGVAAYWVVALGWRPRRRRRMVGQATRANHTDDRLAA